jgi:hypothetical protein
LASGSLPGDGELKVWDALTGQELLTVEGRNERGKQRGLQA